MKLPGAARRRALSVASWLGNVRLEGATALVFVLTTLVLASSIRWFLLGELSVRLLFPTMLLAVFVSSWVGGTKAGVLGAAITALVGLYVYGNTGTGLTSRDLYSLGFVMVVCLIGIALVGRARTAHDQLREERGWYQALLDHSTEAIGFVAADGTLRYLNRSARGLWGVGDEVIGRPVAAVLQMRRMGQDFVLDAHPQGRATHGDHRRLPEGLAARQNGEWIAVSGSGTWIKRGRHGAGLVFSLQWDEALRHATTQLETTRRHLDALLDANVVGVAAIEEDGRLTSANQALLGMIGVAPNSEASRMLRLSHVLVDEQQLVAGMDQASRDTRLRRVDGTTIWVSLTLASSGPNQALMLVTRIDDRMRAEREAHFRRILLQAIIDEVPAVIAFIRQDGRAEIANRHAREAMGDDFAGRPLEQRVSAELWRQLEPALERAWLGGVEHFMLRQGGDSQELRHLQAQLTPYRGEAGDIEGVVWHAFDVTERLQREQSLTESEYRFRRLAETFSSVVWQATEDGPLTNLFGWQEYTGTISGDSMHQWASAVHPDDVAQLYMFIAQMPTFQNRRDVELRLAHRDGGYRHVALKGIPLEDRTERPRRWIGCIRDIHTRKAYASALTAREAELRLILETVPVRLAYLDPQNVFQWCNRAFAEWFGIGREVCGVPLDALLPSDIIGLLSDALNQAQDGQMTSVEWTYAHPVQGMRWSSSSFTPDFDTDGRVRGVITLCVDSTERHEREASLRRSVAEHQALVENVPHMVWIANPQGQMEYFNQRWYEFTLLCESEAWTAAIHPHERAHAEHAFQAAREAGAELNIEVRYRRGLDSAYRWHLVRATPLRRDDGSILRWYGTCTDIEDQKAAQETLLQAQSRTDQFLATLSHELRNPLAALVANAYLLDQLSPADAQWRETGMTIRRQSVHLKRLVDDLLDISRITVGKVRLNSQIFDVAELCADACRDFTEFAATHGVDLHCDLPQFQLYLKGDPARIRQCIDNLVSNAIKASHDQGQVRIAARIRGEWLEVTVEDDGVGIQQDLLRGIFQPFAQGDAWQRNGLGLGLSIVRKMVELHGGTVHAESEGAGRGSRFVICLPFDPQLRPTSTAEVQARVDGSVRHKGRVMLVDDEQDSARALQYLLELEGHEVHLAGDGTMALRSARSLKPQVIICDIGLPPPMDGLQVAERLRASVDWPLYLVAYSGFGTAQDVERSLKAGFNAHLTKPCSPAVLLAEITRGLDTLGSDGLSHPSACRAQAADEDLPGQGGS